MIINHNMNALNAHRNMTGNTASAGKSMEKLSSGLRINRAGDDAAGLAISEKMRGQIRGLDQASRNAQDGISLIQTAEGALNETHNILQRMRELSVQSANDTNITEDRAAIQEEMNALTQEIDRISEQTEFNKQALLNGSFKGDFQIGANGGQTISLKIDGMDSSNLNLISGASKTETVTSVGAGTPTKNIANGEYTIKGDKLIGSDGKAVENVAVDLTAGTVVFTEEAGKTQTYTFDEAKLKEGQKVTIKDGKGTVEHKTELKDVAKKLAAGTYEVKDNLVLRDGKEVGSFDSAAGTLKIGDDVIKASDLGITVATDKITAAMNFKFTINGADVTSSDKASGSIETINKAIEQVSTQRSKLGAVQNRLEHTTANLNNTSENLTAAESRVRDVDMAKEMMNFSKNNILSQAAQAMLAQANQQPQGVLQLLR